MDLRSHSIEAIREQLAKVLAGPRKAVVLRQGPHEHSTGFEIRVNALRQSLPATTLLVCLCSGGELSSNWNILVVQVAPEMLKPLRGVLRDMEAA